MDVFSKDNSSEQTWHVLPQMDCKQSGEASQQSGERTPGSLNSGRKQAAGSD